MGGRNGIRVFADSNARNAGEHAISTARMEESIDLNDGKCVIRCASWAGNINYVSCMVTL